MGVHAPSLRFPSTLTSASGIFRQRSSFASQAAGRVQLTCHLAAQRDVLCALWAWHAAAGKRRRTRQRLDVGAHEFGDLVKSSEISEQV